MNLRSKETEDKVEKAYNFYLKQLAEQFGTRFMLSKKEVSLVIGMSESTLYRNLQKRVDLPPFKKEGNSHYLFPMEGVARWLAEQSN